MRLFLHGFSSQIIYLQCGSLSFLAISTKIWWLQFQVVKCIMLAVDLIYRLEALQHEAAPGQGAS